MENCDATILENARLCAKQGWQSTLVFKDGETFPRAYITATDFDKYAIVVERIGERHLKPRLVYLTDLKELRPDWS